MLLLTNTKTSRLCRICTKKVNGGVDGKRTKERGKGEGRGGEGRGGEGRGGRKVRSDDSNGRNTYSIQYILHSCILCVACHLH